MVILKVLALIVILIGVTFIFDARILTMNWFGFGDQNDATTGMKILGSLLVIISAIIIYVIN